jgi:cytochrome P450
MPAFSKFCASETVSVELFLNFILHNFTTMLVLQNISLLSLGVYSVGTIVSILIVHECYNFFFPRKDALHPSYPFQSIVSLILNQHRQLELITEYFNYTYADRGKKTFILQTVILPPFVATIDPSNVQYILKDNWKNFGKGANIFKPRLQGLLGNGIFNSDGKQWFAHRKTSSHLFKMNKFKGNILHVFNDDLNQLIDVFNTKLAASTTSDCPSSSCTSIVVDIHDYLHRFTLESISRIAFGISLGCITNAKVTFAKDFDYCTMCINDSFLNPLWMFERYFTPKGWKYFYCLFRINGYAKRIITERRQEMREREETESQKIKTNERNSPNESASRAESVGVDISHSSSEKHLIEEDKSDLLSLYLDNKSFQDLLGANSHEDANKEELEHLTAFMEPNDSNLRDVILNMVIAGRDTTAQAISWSFFRMCLHPETQVKLREEARNTFSSEELELLMSNQGKGKVSFATLQLLKYTEAFCMEVLRLHPSVPKEAKEVYQDDVLPDGTEVKAGDLVAFLPWTMGRDKDLWGNDAEEFHPERFLELATKPSPFKFIAFQVSSFCCITVSLSFACFS